MQASDKIPADPMTQGQPGHDDEGGLRAPPGLSFWGKAWWWFDFLILVKLARLRFIAVLVAIGAVITQWDTLVAYYERWTRPAGEAQAVRGDMEYFCPMHPTIVRDNPKEKCPICFMPLSKRKKGDTHTESLPAGVVNRVQLSPYRVVLAGVQTWTVDYLPLTKRISAVGYVEFNERGQRTVSARVPGRIDKLYVNETGKMVAEGDELALVYSPELFSSVQSLLVAQRSNNAEMLRSTRMRLELLGISERQLNGILTSGKATTHLEIPSPISGHIIKKYVREGQYVEEGMALYDVADLSTVWIQAQVYEDDLPFLPLDHSDTAETDASNKLAVTVTTPSIPDERFRGTVDFVYPHMDQETRTVTVRCEVENPHPHKLRPGATATASFEVPASNLPVLVAAVSESREQREQLEQGLVLAVPESSVIDTGSQTIVYRETLPGVFEGVLVRLGPRMANAEEAAFFPVLAGLQPGDRIVTAGSFLVDAETRLNPAAGSIYFGGSSGSKTASTTVRPSTPEDPDLKIEAALAKLPAEDRTLAQLQGYCPVLSNSRLGSMGPPVKLSFEGETVFICCAGCKAEALKDPQATLANVREGKKASRANEGRSASAAHQQNTSRNATQAINTRAGPETTIQKALAALPSAERQLAEKQRFCAVQHENRLGSMGAPYKVMIEGQAVFLCCEACKDEALTHAQETLDRVAKLKQSAAAPEGK